LNKLISIAVARLGKLLLTVRLSLSTEKEVLPEFSYTLANDNYGCVLSQTYLAISF